MLKKLVRRAAPAAVVTLGVAAVVHSIKEKKKRKKQKRRERIAQAQHNSDHHSISSEEGEEECVICLRSLTGQVPELKCAHRFHKHCLQDWTQRKSTCPLCHADLRYLTT